jgi:S-adenosylmethionine hydrolase
VAISPPRRQGSVWHGEIVFVDHFGNLITNLPGEGFSSLSGFPVEVQIGDEKLKPRWVRTYADAEPGTVVALISSSDTLEIAVPQGSAADRLGVCAGMPLWVIVET